MSRLNLLLAVATVLCALLLITSQHKARKLLNELELEQERSKQLTVEWGQLQLEQSTWATPSRVEKLARERLHMLTPDPRRTMVVPVTAAAPDAGAAAPASASRGAQARQSESIAK